MRSVASVELSCTEPLPDSVRQSAEPILLRGYVAHWPAVIQCSDLSSTQEYLRSFWNDAPLTVYVGDESIDGRFFYNSSADGFNFLSGKATLAQVFDRLADKKRDPSFHTIYVGSTPVDEWLPGFRQINDINLQRPDALVSFWLGSPTTVSAHFDFPDNIACAVAGQRTFTLFPPEQLENLYVGPIDRTPSGQAISLVDHKNPDFNQHPKYAQALEHAIEAQLAPGDALFIPSMWWHHVQAQDDFNMLVNYWWCESPEWMGAPSVALNHAILALRDLPARQRAAWRGLFEHYVFGADSDHFAHIPEQLLGVLAPLDETAARQLRADLLNRLNR